MKSATVLGLWWQGAAVLSAALVVVAKIAENQGAGLPHDRLVRRFDGPCCHDHCGDGETQVNSASDGEGRQAPAHLGASEHDP